VTGVYNTRSSESLYIGMVGTGGNTVRCRLAAPERTVPLYRDVDIAVCKTVAR